MLWAQKLRLKLQTLFRRELTAQQLHDELQFHLEQQIAENIAAGMNAEEARYAAILDTRPLALINETFARKYFTGRNPVGLRIGLVDDRSARLDTPNLEVVGVVKDL